VEGKKEQRWYFRIDVLVIALLCLGPLALPLIWFNPRFSLKAKIFFSIIVLILSYYLFGLLQKSLGNIKSYYEQLKF
jgi:lipopolysaccharide export LptBFGC system permease protein LptF